MANLETQFNPCYSTIKSILLETKDGSFSFNISEKNEEGQYEKIEMVENINEPFPNGSLVVRDTKDIVTFIKKKKIEVVKFLYFSGSSSDYDITSTTYLNNAASENEENFVSINFSNKYYKFMQSTALLDRMPGYTPLVYRADEFIKFVANNVLSAGLTTSEQIVAKNNQSNLINKTKNYILYRPLSPADGRLEDPADNVIQYMNYVSSMACGGTGAESEPRFMFWTNWDNQVNFKYFEKDIEKDIWADPKYLSENYLRFAISSTDSPLITLTKMVNVNGETKKKEFVYRKINYFKTDPADQFISKNYYYVKKTPKFLDNFPSGITSPDLKMAYATENLMFNYQDEGQKYNIEIVSSSPGVTYSGFTAGASEIMYDKEWGYYNKLLPLNTSTNITLLGQEFGTSKAYSQMILSGFTGYMPYVDNTHMWKNMFDITEIHPHYPTYDNLSTRGITSSETNLQKIINIRHKVFQDYIKNESSIKEKEEKRLELMRKIEKQNFLMYVLCCISKQEESFFALLTRYEKDNTYPDNETRVPYRYNWVRLNFNSPYGLTGPVISSGGISGGTYWMHQIEKWSKDSLVRGNTGEQDDTWAINLNEHGLTGGYLPPGWVSNPPTGFNWRPIGASSAQFSSKDNIHHIVKMNAIPMTDLLLESQQIVNENYVGKYLYYFTATNIVDGSC